MECNKGFTLLELMVAVAIFAVLSAIAVPNYIGWLPKHRLNQAASALYSDMQKARMEAIRGNQNWAIVFDTANDRYVIYSEPGDDGSWTTVDTGQVEEKRVELASLGTDIKFGHGNATAPVATSFGGDNVTYTVPENNVALFNSQGTGGSGYVYLQNGRGDAASVGTRTSGLIRQLIWTGSGWK